MIEIDIKLKGKAMPEVVEVLVEGGKATPGPPLGPALGPLGVNIKAVVDEINERTRAFEGMQVPVKIIVEKGKFEIEVGTPPTSALIKKELGIEKAKRESGLEFVGDLPMEKVVEIARMKLPQMLTDSVKKAVKQVIGTCVSMGVKVDGKPPKLVQKEIDEGKYDNIFE